jgi:hypothetical protein
MKYIVVYGGSADWQKSLGPFKTYAQALEEAERITESSWWITQMREPDEQVED